MRRNSFLILTATTLLITGCNHRELSLVNLNGNEVMVVSPDRIRDSVRIHLSEIADSMRIIPLETRPECLISQATYYLTNKYILARTKTAILQFDMQGRFIRILANRGEGPGEYMAADWVVDEKTNRLILSDEPKTGYFMQFDLHTGEQLSNIPKAIPSVTRRFLLTRFGSLACVPYLNSGSGTEPLYLYWQDLQGNLIDKVMGPAGLQIFRGNYLEAIPGGYRYMLAMANRDTIYSLTDKKLIPAVVFIYRDPVPDNMETVGFRYMKISLETDRYLFCTNSQVVKLESSGENQIMHWAQTDFVIDKSQKAVSNTSGIYNDFIGATLLPQQYRIQPNGFIFNAIQSLELIGISERTIANPKSDQKLIWRMEQIRNQTNREDNPILIVGKIRR